MDEYRFERLSKDNLYNLIHLYKDCFKLKVDLEFLKKKYNTISFGVEYTGFLAFEKKTNELAGYYGVFPMVGKQDGKEVLIAQSGDTMTHPKHQGKGLFTKLAKATYSLARNEGISFVFGFPNKNSYPGFKNKLDWQFYSESNTYVIKTGALPFDKLSKKINLIKGLYTGFVSYKLRDLIVKDRFQNSLESQDRHTGFIDHDERFYAYKVFYKQYVIRIKGLLCIIRIDGRLWIGDIESCTRDQFLEVVEELILLGKKTGCSSVHFSVTDGTFYDRVLKEKFEIKSKNPIGYLSFDNKVDPSKFAYNAVDFDTY